MIEHTINKAIYAKRRRLNSIGITPSTFAVVIGLMPMSWLLVWSLY